MVSPKTSQATSQETAPGDNLHVSGLPAGTTEDLIHSIFGAGVTQCRVMQSKHIPDECVALVRFHSAQEAAEARLSVDGTSLSGVDRPIVVKFAGGKGGVRSAPASVGGVAAPLPSSYGKAAAADWGCGGMPAAFARSAPYQMICKVPEAAPNANLFVAGLPQHIDEDWCRQLFCQYGTVVECKVLPPKVDPSTSNALVRFRSIEEAASVKSSLQGCSVSGCHATLSLEFARSGAGASPASGQQTPQFVAVSPGGNAGRGACAAPSSAAAMVGGKGLGKGGKGSGRMEEVIKSFQAQGYLPGHDQGNDDNALYVNGLTADCEDVHLFKLCAPFGAIAAHGVTAMKHPDGTCRGFGFVNFVHPESVQAAVNVLHGVPLPDGGVLKVSPKRSKADAVDSGAWPERQVYAEGDSEDEAS